MDILEELKYRGLINQISNERGLREKLKKEKIFLYCGFDPTAPSLHVGNLLLVLTLKRFQQFGHKPIVVIGGATALIGDPSGKTKERPLLLKEKVEESKKKIENEIKKILREDVEILDNSEWLSRLNLIDFLRDFGKDFQVSQMISREWVKKRLSTTGISFCEFSYQVLQAIDFFWLFKEKNCQLQIGGSDQWGNIVAGIELIRKKLGKEAFGLTLPLLLTKSGKKFGKTEKDTIFLDKNLTSPYKFYQFWINVEDRDVIKLLKFFTFLKKEEIFELEKGLKKDPKKKEAQKALAEEMTKLVHGEEELKRVKKISEILFYGNVQKLSEKEIEEAFFNVPSKEIFLSNEKISAIDILVKSGAVKSRSEAKRLIKQKGIKINGQEVELDQVLSLEDAIGGKYFIVKKGKRNYFLLKCLK